MVPGLPAEENRKLKKLVAEQLLVIEGQIVDKD